MSEASLRKVLARLRQAALSVTGNHIMKTFGPHVEGCYGADNTGACELCRAINEATTALSAPHRAPIMLQDLEFGEFFQFEGDRANQSLISIPTYVRTKVGLIGADDMHVVIPSPALLRELVVRTDRHGNKIANTHES